ncbi:MAG: hypothetical protein AAF630_00490 [Cyanobacteria bacterium P01_C01_bin.38]
MQAQQRRKINSMVNEDGWGMFIKSKAFATCCQDSGCGQKPVD